MFITIGTFETRPRAKFGFVLTTRGESVFVPEDLVEIPLNLERVAVMVYEKKDGSLKAMKIHPLSQGPIPMAWRDIITRQAWWECY